MKLPFVQLDYNATTGNYINDADNPNNPENVIIQHCLDHAERVAAGENVVQDLVNSGLVPRFYHNMSCVDDKESKFQDSVNDAMDSVREAFD